MRYFLIFNPRSRGGKSAGKFQTIRKMLDLSGVTYSFGYGATCQTIGIMSREANLSGYDVVVAVGGDGTINAVLNGFFDEDGRRISKASMGVIYTGTSPDFCKSYGIPLGLEDAVSTLLQNNSRNIRVVRISLISDPGGTTEVRYYSCCANIGLGALVARRANRLRKKTGDIPGTLISLLWTLTAYKSRKISLDLDGFRYDLENIINISAGRTRYIASGIKVAKGMDDDDERLYYLVAEKPGLRGLPSLLSQAYSGNIRPAGVLSLRYGLKAIMTSDKLTEVEFDGDPAGYLPCEVIVATDPLSIIVR